MWLVAAMLVASTAKAATTHDGPLLARAHGERPAFVQTQERLVRIQTGTKHLEDLAHLGDLLQAALAAPVERVPSEAPARAADHLVARLRRQGGRRALVMAHMDTVYPAGTLALAPFRTEGDTAWVPASRMPRGHCPRATCAGPDARTAVAGIRRDRRSLQQRRGALFPWLASADPTDSCLTSRRRSARTICFGVTVRYRYRSRMLESTTFGSVRGCRIICIPTAITILRNGSNFTRRQKAMCPGAWPTTS